MEHPVSFIPLPRIAQSLQPLGKRGMEDETGIGISAVEEVIDL